MNKERYNQVVDEAYENYCKSFDTQSEIESHSFDTDPMTKIMFVEKIKNLDWFSEKWGLKIEERELSLKEQAHAYNNWLEKQNYNPKHQSKIIDIDKLSESNLMTILQSLPGPTKLITLTYNNETIESYE